MQNVEGIASQLFSSISNLLSAETIAEVLKSFAFGRLNQKAPARGEIPSSRAHRRLMEQSVLSSLNHVRKCTVLRS